MGSELWPEQGAFAGQLANHARHLQSEAREALARGEFTRASALIGDAELLAEDVHGMVGDMERREISALAALAVYDVRQDTAKAARQAPNPAATPARGLRIAIAASLAMSFALVEC